MFLHLLVYFYLLYTNVEVFNGIMENVAHRHIGETNMNVYSSRSHTIFRMVR